MYMCFCVPCRKCKVLAGAGMSKVYGVSRFIMDSGERYCLVVDRSTGLPGTIAVIAGLIGFLFVLGVLPLSQADESVASKENKDAE